MLTIDITSDLKAAMRDVDDFFWKDIPFAMAGAMVDTMFDVKRQITTTTYPNAFTVRNKAFANRLWRVKVDGAKGSAMYRLLRNELKTGGIAAIMLQQDLDREYMEKHVTGGTKTPQRGRSIAIPVGVGRTATGRIPAAKKPIRVRDRKGTFIKKGRGGTRLIMERQRSGETRLWYVLAPSAKIDRRFRFYEDAEQTVFRVFGGHMSKRMSGVIAKSRFT